MSLIRERWKGSGLDILGRGDKAMLDSEIMSEAPFYPLQTGDGILGAADSETYWYAVYTRSRHEMMVKRQLDGKSIPNFLPLYSKLSQWKDRKKEIQLPLFPGYIFVRILIENRLDILKTMGVVYFVGDGSSPPPISEDSINSIQSFLRQGLKCDPHPYLKIGNRVRITDGPLNGIEGILVRKKNRTLLVVSVDLIQRSVSVEIESWKIERI
jgi:transcription antitermination factor NusG